MYKIPAVYRFNVNNTVGQAEVDGEGNVHITIPQGPLTDRLEELSENDQITAISISFIYRSVKPRDSE